MKNRQSLNYQEYRIMLENGESFAVSRAVCFCRGEASTAENPLKQRWYYSPDCTVAIRLPRNEMGEAIGKANAADLRDLAYKEGIQIRCIGQFSWSSCPASCAASECTACTVEGEKEGVCRRKCEGCALYEPITLAIDGFAATDEDGEDVELELFDAADTEGDFIRIETENECKRDIATILATLSERDRAICEMKQHGLSNRKIAAELGIFENVVRRSLKRLLKVFDKAGLKKYL